MLDKQIKIEVGSSYDIANLIFSDSQITFVYGDYSIDAEGDYPFMVLLKIRKELEQKNIKLIINGSRKDVYPSGLSLLGTNAYIQTIGKSCSLEDLVNIFDVSDRIDLIGTVEEQLIYHEEWVKSIQ